MATIAKKLIRVAVILLCAAAGGLALNLLAQALMVSATGIFSSSGADALTYMAARMREPYLGFSFERIPLAAAALGALTIIVVSQAPRDMRARKINPARLHGSQRFATVQEFKVFEHKSERRGWPCPPWCERVADDNIILSLNARLAASAIPRHIKHPKSGVDLEDYVPNRNMFWMAGSGAGKSYRMLGSQVLQLNGSMVFTDPSGELARRYTRFLEAHGYEVSILDFRDEEHILASSRYNPLAYCTDITSINNLIAIWIANTKGEDTTGDQQFFRDQEINWLTAVMGLMVFWFRANGNMRDCTMPSLIDFLELAQASAADGDMTDLDLIFEGTYERDGFPGFAQYVMDTYGEGALERGDLAENAVLSAFRMFKQNYGAAEQRAGVISSCAARLRRLNAPAVQKLMGTDELALAEMADRKRALFLCVRDGQGPYDFIAAMILSQLFEVSKNKAATSSTGHLPMPLWVYLDEVGNIAKIPGLERLFAESRKYWINLVAIVQDGKQLEARYGKQEGSIKANSAIFVYLGSSRFEDCEQISKEIGSTTRAYQRMSQSRSRTGGSTSISTEYVKVPLITPEALYNWNDEDGLAPDALLVKYRRGMWLMDKKPDPTRHPRWAELERAGSIDLLSWSEHRRKRPATLPQTIII